MPWLFCGDWHYDNEDFGEALIHYEESIELGTINPNAYIRAASSASHTGDLERAYSILKLSTSKLSNEDLTGILWYNLGCYATRLQKNDEAMRYLTEAFNKGYVKIDKYLSDPDLIPFAATGRFFHAYEACRH